MKKAQDLHPPNRTDVQPDRDLVRAETLGRIKRLQARSSRGLWAMALFIAISTGALWDFSFLPTLPETVRAMLGRPPSPLMISGALVLYAFSAIILTLSRMMGGSEQYSGFSHVAYLTAFYVFYHFARAMEENFWAVFVAGITILGLESYHIWNFCSEALRKEKDILDAIEKVSRE